MYITASNYWAKLHILASYTDFAFSRIVTYFMFIGNFSLHAYLFEGIGIPGTRIAVFNYHVGAGN